MTNAYYRAQGLLYGAVRKLRSKVPTGREFMALMDERFPVMTPGEAYAEKCATWLARSARLTVVKVNPLFAYIPKPHVYKAWPGDVIVMLPPWIQQVLVLENNQQYDKLEEIRREEPTT